MIAEIIPELYDVDGRRILAPTSRKDKKVFCSTFPMGRYVSQPLRVKCTTIAEIRRFLRDCKYVTDREQFHREDYWMPPEEFEKTKKGDCDDFALWTWRQFLAMGYKTRYVVGRAGKYGNGHAWVTFDKDGRHFIVEPLSSFVGEKLPRLSFARYVPSGSVEWDGKQMRYFTHEEPKQAVPSKLIFALLAEWLWFWLRFWGRLIGLLCVAACLAPIYLIKRFWQKKGAVEESLPSDQVKGRSASE
jgi:hypothetical protein